MISVSRKLTQRALQLSVKSSRSLWAGNTGLNGWLSKIPQGFKNFYPQGEGKTVADGSKKESSSAGTSTGGDNSKKSNSNKNRNNKPPEDPLLFWRRVAMFVGFGVSVYALQMTATRYIFGPEKYVLLS